MTLNIGGILSRAWKLTWNHKILWIFGFLAMLGGGSGGGNGGGNGGNGGSRFNFPSAGNSGGFPQTQPFGAGANLPPGTHNFFDQLNHLDTTTILLIILGVCLCLLLLWLGIQILSILGQGSLIGGINLADNNDKVGFGQAWAIGRKYFWRLVLLRLLRIAVSIVVWLVLIIPGFCLAICTCCLGNIVLSIVVGFLIAYAFVFMDLAVVLEGKTVGESIHRAYSLLRENLGPVVIVALILFGISLGVAVVTLVIFLPFGGLLVASLYPVFTSTGSANMALLIAAIVFFVIGLLASLLLGAVWTTYRNAVMVLVYKQLMTKPVAEPPVIEQALAPSNMLGG
jgi:hypothetical protein